MNRRSFVATVAGVIGMLLAPWLGRNARGGSEGKSGIVRDSEDREWTILGYTHVQRHFYRIPDGKHGSQWVQECLESVGAVNTTRWLGRPAGTVTLASASVQIPKGGSVGCVECIFGLVSEEEGARRRQIDLMDLFWLEYRGSSRPKWIKQPCWAVDIRGSQLRRNQ